MPVYWNHSSGAPHAGRIRRRRPTLFTLMLMAFLAVIVFGFCGTGTVFVISTISTGGPNATGTSGQEFGPPWIAEPGTVSIQPGATPAPAIPRPTFRPSFDWRGPVSALLAFAAVLLGAATFFSSRVSRPLTRLTKAAQTMAKGDLTVRVRRSPIRELDELATAFNSMAESLAEADRQRRQMTADVAHELRTPLAIIRGRLEGLQDGVYSATPEHITSLLNDTELLQRLIEDLRLLALADAGQLPLYKESIAPAALLNSVGRSFSGQAQSRGIDLSVAVLPDLPEVDADPQRVSQVLGNLVGNALIHTPPQGSVVLNAWCEARSEQEVVCLSVSDTGSGIAEADLPHIFDRFYRADPVRERAGGGAGLGLAIAERIIQAHGGEIWAESALGKGTTITFCLPVAAGRPD